MGRHEVRNGAGGSVTWCQGAPWCPDCNSEEAAAGFQAGSTAGISQVTCPECGHTFTPPPQPVRVTESVETAEQVDEADASKPYGDVPYADPGYQADKKKRYPIDTKAHAKSAWSYINQAGNAAKYSAANLKKVKAKITTALKKFGVKVSTASEAVIDGKRTFDETRDAVRDALTARIRTLTGASYCWVYIADLTDDQVVYSAGDDDLYQCGYSIADDGQVSLGDPMEVVRTYAPAGDTSGEPDEPMPAGDGMGAGAEAATEASDRIAGRVIEAKGTDETGGRIYRVRIIAYGDSKNGRRYPEAVMREATSLYEGARAYDHHRSQEELTSSTLVGLVGSYRSVAAESDGLYGDLHLLPGATHAAEALDASLAAQDAGLPPLVGVSHDVRAHFRHLVDGSRRLQEAVQIVNVQSADVVAAPAAGGKAVRAVAGGEGSDDDNTDQAGTSPAVENTEESDVTVTTDGVLAAFQTATDEQLAAVGLSRAGTPAKESAPPKPPAEPEPVREATGEPKVSFMGRMMIRSKVEDAGLPATAIEAITTALPERITESDVDAQVAAIKAGLGLVERAGLTPTASTQVTQEAFDKKKLALDRFFEGKFNQGYYSFRQAFMDFTGRSPRAWDEDFNRTILRESIGAYDSAERASESMDSSSWNLVLGDSITRRLVAEYMRPSLQTWQRIVSSTPPVNDFRTQRIDRVGGYGTLPAVNQGAPYQPLTSPSNEEASYAVTKRGGTEDLTMEMIANDDVRSISKIPFKLGLAAAQTLYRFVWDMLATNATCTYDSTALFHANHANTDNPAVLGQSTLSAGRKKMRKQAAYGDSSDVLSLVPRLLVVPSDLEEIAFQLCTSHVAVPSTPAGPSDTPNLHQNMEYLTIDYWSDANDWFITADPTSCPTIEVGFYLGRQEPELFTQSDPNVGSVFSSDKLTYKIRHIYSGTVLDHRAFYRGAN